MIFALAPRGKTHQLVLTSASLDISDRTKSIETTAQKTRTNYFLTLANTPVSENKKVRFYVSRFSYHVILFVVFQKTRQWGERKIYLAT